MLDQMGIGFVIGTMRSYRHPSISILPPPPQPLLLLTERIPISKRTTFPYKRRSHRRIETVTFGWMYYSRDRVKSHSNVSFFIPCPLVIPASASLLQIRLSRETPSKIRPIESCNYIYCSIRYLFIYLYIYERWNELFLWPVKVLVMTFYYR